MEWARKEHLMRVNWCCLPVYMSDGWWMAQGNSVLFMALPLSPFWFHEMYCFVPKIDPHAVPFSFSWTFETDCTIGTKMWASASLLRLIVSSVKLNNLVHIRALFLWARGRRNGLSTKKYASLNVLMPQVVYNAPINNLGWTCALFANYAEVKA